MKKLISLALAFLLSLTLLAGCGASGGQAAASAGGAQGTLTIGVSGENHPFCFVEQDVLQGYEIDVWNEIGSRMGYNIEFKTSDFTSLFGMLDSGGVDSIGHCVATTPQRQEKYLFTDPYLYSDFNIFTAKDSPLATLADFNGQKIGVMMGGEGHRVLEAMNGEQDLGIEIIGYEGAAAMDEDVQLGRIAARLGPKLPTIASIEKNDLNMAPTDITLYTETNAYPLPQDEAHEALLPQINDALNSMREDGTLAELSVKWFNVDATQPH